MAWAVKQLTGSPTRKAVLMILAEAADSTGSTFVSNETLAMRAELSKRAVVAAIGQLEVAGFLRLARRHNPVNGSRTSNITKLSLGRPSAPVALVQGADGALEEGAGNRRPKCISSGAQGARPSPYIVNEPIEDRYTPPPPPAGGTRTSAGRLSDQNGSQTAADQAAEAEAFANAWAAYPLIGRVNLDRSRQAFAAEVARGLPPASIASAAAAFAAWVAATPAAEKRTPTFHAWLSRGNFRNFLPTERTVERPAWTGPEHVWAAVERAKTPEWAAAYLGITSWRDLPSKAVVCRSSTLRKLIERGCGSVLKELDVDIALEVPDGAPRLNNIELGAER